jgi:hypothetical protein
MSKKFSIILACAPALIFATVAYAHENAASKRLQLLENKLNAMLPSQSAANEAVAAAPWSAQPLCNTEAGNIPECAFNHQNGHGLFVLQQANKHSFPNFLVCASTAGQTRSFLDFTELVSSRCLVSSLDWANGSGRSDFRGVFNWANMKSRYDILAMPAPLAQHCASAFSEATYCSPSLLVLSTRTTEEFDVCSLYTKRSSLNLIVLEVHRGNSKWKCERKDLRNPDSQERLPVGDWNCVPDLWGNVNELCALPYIPTTEPLRAITDDRQVGAFPTE